MSQNYIRAFVARLTRRAPHSRDTAATRSPAPVRRAPSDANRKTVDDLVELVRSLRNDRSNLLLFGDTRVLPASVLDALIVPFERVFLVERGVHELQVAGRHEAKVLLLKSLIVAPRRSVDIALGCPILAQITPTFTQVAPRQIWRLLRADGHLVSLGISPAKAPEDAEAREYFTRCLSAEAPEVPPELIGKFAFSGAQPRHKAGHGYLTWVTLRKIGLDTEVDTITPPIVETKLDLSNLPIRLATPDIEVEPVIPVERHNGVAFLPGAVRDEKLVFSLVPNSCVHDARVMRHARALTNHGWRVRIYATLGDGLPTQEIRDGIEIHRFAGFQTDSPLAPEISEAALDIMGPYRAFIDERLQHWRAATPLSEQLSAENQRLRDLLDTTTDKNEKFILRKSIASFSSIYRQMIPHLRQQRRHDLLKLRFFFFAANFLNQTFDTKPAIIHAHDLPSLPGAIHLAAATNAKVIFDAHELETERAPPLPVDQQRFIAFMESNWLQQVDRMVTVCDSIADFYQDRFPGPRATVFMNIPEFKNIETQEFDLRKAANLAADAKVIIYTGATGREPRGLHKVVDALRLVDEANLIILGPRTEAGDAWLLDIAEASGVRGRVHLLPPVATDEVVNAIRTADAGICPIQDVALSYRFSMPNKLFECAFAEVPICVSDLPEMARFVRNLGIGVVMDQTDPRAIANALRTVLNNRTQYALTPESRRKLNDEYSFETQSRHLQDLYLDVERTLNLHPTN